ncbi:MAG TPA: hypothetical protein VFW94_23700 [Candidatus Acidoferrales bacterium]|nr:hypothetical protein [Candidatus Acidoferrales bacterium]
MSVQKITKTIYRCTCELDDCPSLDPKTGKRRSWDSVENKIPSRCNFCGRFSWNGIDKRTRAYKERNGKAKK